ncbi:ubiquitin carboxyl-terminal hydrolase 34 [Thecamonas trahens ATCC 50062]|uniref:Ubiquitin carboxyl-terminal hydrolase 34 n=1 Tax=Thecamonas trahens ATCC 50062 TaxID=461836 RepID=A0A0L0DEA6_THETB|nr:ubiquitin carboxyl-terminal hydrolase 34 [Thecamonas trahens ATCC 50062]KNC49653.1 ubiquitin carboxyl-terminal hydrolase 34 [Thecamonas trahens ATCC 50062]|eukprot:XP_013757752.1 ubiquitin carboxyl-terminal hydrolase 34 [Thecamonas trahens ATCC 50062]
MGSNLSRRLAAGEESGSIDLRGLSLSTIPGKVWSLTHVVRLHLGWNSLKTLPHALGDLPSLAVLYLNHNSFSIFPRALLKCTRLRRLYLNSNALSSLPDELGDLVYLKVLAVSDNYLTTLPPSVCKLKLHELYLSQNKFELLPEALGALTDLRTLAVAGNNLKALPFAALLRLHDLKAMPRDGNVDLGELASMPLRELMVFMRKSVTSHHRHMHDSSSSMWRTRSFTEADLAHLGSESETDSGDDNMDPVVVKRRRKAKEVVGAKGSVEGLKKRTLAEIMEAANQLPGVESSLHPLLPLPEPATAAADELASAEPAHPASALAARPRQKRLSTASVASSRASTATGSMPPAIARVARGRSASISCASTASPLLGSAGGTEVGGDESAGALSQKGSFYRKSSKLMNTEDVVRTMRVLLDESMVHNTELMEKLGKVESLRGEERSQFKDTRHTLRTRIAAGEERVANLLKAINSLRGSGKVPQPTPTHYSEPDGYSASLPRNDSLSAAHHPDDDPMLNSRLVTPASGLYSRSSLQWAPPTSPNRRHTSTRIPAPSSQVVFLEDRADNERYLKSYWASLDMAITTDSANPTNHLANALEHLERAVAEVEAGEGETVFSRVFFNYAMPLLAQTLLERTYPVPAWMVAALDFERRIAQVVVAALKAGTATDKMVRALRRMVTSSMEFYEEHGTVDDTDHLRVLYYPEGAPPAPEDAPKVVDEAEAEADPPLTPEQLSLTVPPEFVTLSPTDHATSIFLLDAIETLGGLGLFDHLVAALGADEAPPVDGDGDDAQPAVPKLASSTLTAICRVVGLCAKHLAPSFWDPYSAQLLTKLRRHIDALPQAALRDQSLVDLVDCLNVLARTAARAGNHKLNRDIQAYKLALAWRYVQLPYLTQCLQGVEAMQHFIAVAKKEVKENSTLRKPKQTSRWMSATGTGFGVMYSRAGGTAYNVGNCRLGGAAGPALDMDYLLGWFDDNDIFARVLKFENAEVLAKGCEIIRFVATQRGLTTPELDAIWHAVTTVFESLQLKLFEFVLDLVGAIPFEQVCHLDDKLCELPPSAFNNQVLTFVSDFTRKALEAAGASAPDALDDALHDQRLFGLQTLWDLVTSGASSGSSNGTVAEACAHLQSLLHEFPAHREYFVAKVMANLESGVALSPTLRILIDLVRGGADDEITREYVEELDARYNLVQLLVNALSAVSSGDEAEGVTQACLAALEHVITSSALILSADAALALWDALEARGAVDAAAGWLASLNCEEPVIDPYTGAASYPAFTIDEATALYSSRVLPAVRRDPAMVSPALSALFCTLFALVNTSSSALRRLTAPFETKTRSFEALVGIDALEALALSASDDGVANDALYILARLYTHVSTLVDAPAVGAVRNAFVRANLKRVLDAAPAPAPRPLFLAHAVLVAEAQHGLFAPHGGRASAPLAVPPAEHAALAAGVSCVHDAELMDALFGLLANAPLRDGIWSLLCALPTEPAVASAVAAPTPETLARALGEASPGGTHSVFRVLYGVLALEHALGGGVVPDPRAEVDAAGVTPADAAAAVTAADGFALLTRLFTADELLDKGSDGFEYGKKAASSLSALINSLFAGGDVEVSALDGSFVQGLVSQIHELAGAAGELAKPTGTSSSTGSSAAVAPGILSIRSMNAAEALSGTVRGTRIANCHYGATQTLFEFEVSGASSYRVAVYCVDFNTHRRHQTMLAFVGDTPELAECAPEGSVVALRGLDFHNGCWVVWDVHAETEGEEQASQFNLLIDNADASSPNWTLSAFLLDPLPADNMRETSHYPTLVEIDTSSQGRWHGRYGSAGGVLLGRVDLEVEARVPGPRLVAFDNDSALRYEWVEEATSDERALQPPPPCGGDIEVEAVEAEDEASRARRLVVLSVNAPAAPDGDEPDAAEPGTPESGSSEASLGDVDASNSLSDDDGIPVQQAVVVSFGDEKGKDDDDDSFLIRRRAGSGARRKSKSKTKVAGSGGACQALLDMLFTTLDASPSLVAALEASTELEAWLEVVLAKCSVAAIRESAAARLPGLAVVHPPLGARMMATLLQVTQRGEAGRASVASFEQAFEVVLALARDGVAFDTSAAFAAWARDVMALSVVESDDDEAVDSLLVGLLRGLSTCLRVEPALASGAAGDALLDYVFGDCLFSVPADKTAKAVPVCKSYTAREAAFEVLLQLCAQADGKSTVLMESLADVLAGAGLPGPDEWCVDVVGDGGDGDSDSEYGGEVERFKGLKNQGCTCYMNASLQQMFLIPELRESILRVPLAASDDEESFAGNIMCQLQLLFAKMLESRSYYVDTIDFCRTVFLNGEVIQLGQQEDANEFINSLVDQLEPHLKGTPEEAVFTNVFGGSFVNQIVSQECEHISERPEEYLTISVKVQNKRNLQEGLEFFVQGDMLDGQNKYHCEKCDTKVAALKRCVIQHLPNTLALHLIRFEFSFETFENVKVDDRFEFPETLNMKPYTKEGLAAAAVEAKAKAKAEARAAGRGDEDEEDEDEEDEDEDGGVGASGASGTDGIERPDDYYEYRLQGILVHSGTADMGHYYSYIRDREGDEGSARWYEFNDRSVTPFDPSEIAEQTFGGPYEGMASDHSKMYSAYMLFYERVGPKYAPRTYGGGLLEPPTVLEQDPEILDKMWRDSVAAAQRRHFMNATCLQFMWSLVAQEAPKIPVSTSTEVLDESSWAGKLLTFGTRLCFDLLAHCEDKLGIVDKIRELGDMYVKHLPGCVWLLRRLADAEASWLGDVLVVCPDLDIREAMAELVVRVLGAAVAGGCEAEAAQYAAAALATLKACATDPTVKTSQLVSTVLGYAQVGGVRQLCEAGALRGAIELYESNRTPLFHRALRPKHLSLIELISVLGRAYRNPNGPSAADSQGSYMEGPIDDEVLHLLFSKRFLTSVLAQQAYREAAHGLIQHWVPGNRRVADAVMDAALTGLDSFMDKTVLGNYTAAIDAMREIDDGDGAYREARYVEGLIKSMKKAMRVPRTRNNLLALLLEAGASDDATRQHIESHEVMARLMQTDPSLRYYVQTQLAAKFTEVFPALAVSAGVPGAASAAAAAAGVASPPVDDAPVPSGHQPGGPGAPVPSGHQPGGPAPVTGDDE